MKDHDSKQTDTLSSNIDKSSSNIDKSNRNDADSKPGSLFGTKLLKLRHHHGVSQRDLAKRLGVSPAYVSQLESGKKGRPSDRLIHAICHQFNLIWDEADTLFSLADSSKSSIKIDTSKLGEQKTELAKLFAEKLRNLTLNQLDLMRKILDDRTT